LDILITGGAGFVGANLLRQLAGQKHRLRVLDDFSAGRREHLAGLEVEVVEGNILDTDCVARAVAGAEGVVHLAAQTGVPGSLRDPRRDCEVNVVGTLNMLEACRLAGVRRFIFASSNAPLGSASDRR
jgi:nucleoside-diphosphate-sugar epimerase